MDSKDVIPFIKAARNTFDTMFQMQVDCRDPVYRQLESTDDEVSAIITMSGDIAGTLTLTFPMETARRIVAVFTGVEVMEQREDFEDAVGEIANIIASGAKAWFKGKHIEISCPRAIMGAGQPEPGARNGDRITVPCACDCGEFRLVVSMKSSAKPVAPGVSASAPA